MPASRNLSGGENGAAWKKREREAVVRGKARGVSQLSVKRRRKYRAGGRERKEEKKMGLREKHLFKFCIM